MEVPQSALQFGFNNGPGGQHNSRTIMLEELRMLLAACRPQTPLEEYRTAILADNVLLKRTMTTREKSLRALRELYALDRNILLFRALRDLWEEDKQAHPLIALLCAVARDPILRGTATFIAGTTLGTPVTSQMLGDAASASMPDRYKPTVLGVIGRNVASSWKQSGHLSGDRTTVRISAQSKPASVAYALLLGYLCDARGDALFDTIWSRLLDAPLPVLHTQAVAASQRGWLEYRHAGGITDISFRYLLREEGRDQLL